MSQFQKENLTVEDFLEIYSISRGTFYREIKKGRLITKKLGSRTYIKRADAEAWSSQMGVEA